jgi:alpha-mannosidase
MQHDFPIIEKRTKRFLMRLRIQLGFEKMVSVHQPMYHWEPGQTPLQVEFTHDAEPIPSAELKQRKWRPIKVGTRWGGDWESAWFRFHGQVPRQWRGQEVIFRISTGSEACVFDAAGRPLQGLDLNHTDFPAVNPARGGEAVELLVEAAANQRQGRQRDCVLETAALELFRRDRYQLMMDVHFLLDLADTLPTDNTRKRRIIYELNRVADLYGGGTPEEIRVCRQITRKLISVSASGSAHNVAALGHAHIDTAWLWPLRETYRKCTRTFSTVLALMNQYPQYRFGASQPQQYQFIKERHPSLFARIREAVRRGRWEPQGAMWVEPDCNLPAGESFVRQLLYGKRFYEREFGVNVNHLWLPDVFGYSAALPQILKQAEVDFMVTTKISWNQIDVFPFSSFWWEGLDGTRVFTHFPHGYNGNATPQHLNVGVQRFKEKDKASRWLYLFGYGDGGGGPTREHLELLTRAADCDGLPKIHFEAAGKYLPKILAETRDWPQWRGELYLQYHRGTLTTQAWLKKANRDAEFALREAEFLLSAAALSGLPVKEPRQELERYWKLLLLNQFHDILPGSSIGWVYDDARKQFAEIEAGVGVIARRVAEHLAQHVAPPQPPTPAAKPVLVFNTLSWTRDGVISVPLEPGERQGAICDETGPKPTQIVRGKDGDQLLTRAQLPPLGWKVLWVAKDAAKCASSPVTASDRMLENECLQLSFDAQGELVSIFDKERKREVLADGKRGNRLAVWDDFPNDHDAWDLDCFYENSKPVEARCEKTRVVERGPVRAAVRQVRRVGASVITQDIRLSAGSRVIEFFTRVDWRETHRVLRVEFPSALRADRAAYEIQFGHLHRPTHRNTSWDAAQWEVCGHKWADLSEPGYGVALLNDGKYGYKTLDNVLSLTLLRSPIRPDPEADKGRHEFTYALLPHPGTLQEAGVIEAGYELNVAPRCTALPPRRRKDVAGLPPQHSLATTAAANVIVETFKAAEDSDNRIIRLYEAHGAHGSVVLRLGFSAAKISECNLLERADRPLRLRADGSLQLKVRPFQIITLKVRLAKKSR